MAHPTNIAALRNQEFGRLAATGSVYLDYTGAALYPASLVSNDACRLTRQVLGNPHSESGPSLASTEAIARARQLTLGFLDADPAEYEVVFTANASSAMRILAEAFPFRRGSRLVLTADNHNSVNGLRVSALKRRAAVEYVPLDAELRARNPLEMLTAAAGPSLFAFPAQSNFSGVQHPLSWVFEAQERGYHVLVDAAAYVPSNPLSLAKTSADFVALSFYKLFGYPTGVGALVARREAVAMLKRRRSYFGGGAVEFVSVQNNLVRLKAGGEGFEDGTPNFLSMPAVCDGLEWITRVGVARIREHVCGLTRGMLERFAALKDRAIVYGPRDTLARGGVLTFNLVRDGRLLPFELFEAAARERGVAIRGGCFCNPGAAEQAFGVSARKARACLRGPFTISRFRSCLGDNAVGAVRASVGLANSTGDLDALLDLVTDLTQRKGVTFTPPLAS